MKYDWLSYHIFNWRPFIFSSLSMLYDEIYEFYYDLFEICYFIYDDYYFTFYFDLVEVYLFYCLKISCILDNYFIYILFLILDLCFFFFNIYLNLKFIFISSTFYKKFFKKKILKPIKRFLYRINNINKQKII